MINILWTLFEIAVNIYQGFMAVYFVYAFLSGKDFKDFFKPVNIAWSLGYAAVICAENYIFANPEINGAYVAAAFYIFLLFVYGLIEFKSSIAKKFFAAITANVIILLSSTLCGNLTAIIFKEKLEVLMTTPLP